MMKYATRGRRAYVLILVLGLATVVSSLGIAYIEANSTAMPAASNRKFAARAQYLAESGVELAKHYLLYPPTTVAIDDYWRGGNNIAVDATSDFTSVAVAQHATIKDRFVISAAGVAKDVDGSVKGKKAVRAEVLLPPGNIWDLRHALVGKSATTSIPALVQINGNVHGNGALTGSGTCTGAVSACLTALWLGGGPPTSVTSLAPAVALPAASTTYYNTYTLRGTSYSAYLFDANQMTSADTTALNAIDMTTTNPGRVIRTRTGDFRMRAGTVLNGTLLVVGKLEIDGAVQIVAHTGFPSIVCTGNIEATQANDTLTVTGPILCGGGILEQGKTRVNFTSNGAAVISDSLQITGTQSLFRFNWSTDRSWLYNFESAPTRQPITVLSWRED